MAATNPVTIPDGWLAIGTLVAPQGLRGEARIYPETDFPERFEEPGQRWILRPGQTEPEPIELVAGRYHGRGLYVVKFAGVTSCDQVEALRGCVLVVPESDRPPLEENEFHVMDLLGLEVWHQASQTLLGTVVDVLAAGNDLLLVELVGDLPDDEAEATPKTVLIPFVKEIVPVVDLAAKRIEIAPPPGLLELVK